MVAWWLSLTIERQIALVIALSSSIVIIIDFVLFLVNFYGIDRLNAESVNLNRYETVANNDNDMSKNRPRLVSIKSLNMFLAVSCWLYFSLWTVLGRTELVIMSIVFGMFVACIDSIFLKYLRNR